MTRTWDVTSPCPISWSEGIPLLTGTYPFGFDNNARMYDTYLRRHGDVSRQLIRGMSTTDKRTQGYSVVVASFQHTEKWLVHGFDTGKGVHYPSCTTWDVVTSLSSRSQECPLLLTALNVTSWSEGSPLLAALNGTCSPSLLEGNHNNINYKDYSVWHNSIGFVHLPFFSRVWLLLHNWMLVCIMCSLSFYQLR